MKHAPEEYDEYWSGAIRIAAGVVLPVVAYRWLTPFLDHPAFGATAFGYLVFVLVVLAGSFAAVLGLAVVVKTAVRNA